MIRNLRLGGMGVFTMVLVGLLAACNGSSSSSTRPGTAPDTVDPDVVDTGSEAPATVEESLNLLGVATDESPRISGDGVELPETYSPLGARVTVRGFSDGSSVFGAAHELALIGPALDGTPAYLSVIDNPLIGNEGEIQPLLLTGADELAAPWARGSDTVSPTRLRDAAAADIDGDGLQELVQLYLENDQVQLRITTVSDPGTPDVWVQPTIDPQAYPVGDLRVTGGDLDADGREEIVIAVSNEADDRLPGFTALVVIDDAQGSFQPLFSTFFTGQETGRAVNPVLRVGNIDYDVAIELVLVLNEFDPGTQRPTAARFFVYDDLEGDGLLVADSLTVVDETVSLLADVADVTIADLDDDEIGEIVIAGLSGSGFDTLGCNEIDPDDPNATPLRLVLVQYNFAGTGLIKAGSAVSAETDGLYPAGCDVANPWYLRFAMVNGADIDGDSDAELQVNQFVFDGFPEAGLTFDSQAIYRLPGPTLFNDSVSGEQVFDRSSATMVVLDVDGDGLDEFGSYRVGDGEIRFSGLVPNEEAGDDGPAYFLSRVAYLPIAVDGDYATSTLENIGPILVPFEADLTNEGEVQILEYFQHRLVFTEPIVLAALAAPPCAEDIGQVTDACTTAWGRSRGTSVEGERELSLSVARSVGTELEFQAGGGLVVNASTKIGGFMAKVTLTKELGLVRSQAYAVSRSITFESGPMEDSVVFTSVPFDIYDYRLLAEEIVEFDDPQAIGQTTSLYVPRTPVLRVAERNYFNLRSPPGGVQIDRDVFQHTIGDLDSYPSVVERDQLIATNQSRLADLRDACPGCWRVDPDRPLVSATTPFRQFEPESVLPGLVSEEVGVGQGGGATEVTLEFETSESIARSFSRSAELEVEVSGGGVLGGFTVGGSLSHTTTISNSSGQSYVGSVGSIDAANFEANQYRYGMFTYLQGDPDGSGQEFEVINYWVERN